MANVVSSQSTVTLQNVADALVIMPDLKPILTMSGYTSQPMLTIATDVMQEFMSVSTPWKLNEFNLPPFYANSWQQDYALPITNLGWLTDGTAIDINNTGIPKPGGWIEVGRRQSRTTAAGTLSSSVMRSPVFTASFQPNNLLYYGTWGDQTDGNATWGNNPVAGSVYTNPLTVNSQPNNPITQIQDANGNYLILTGYGTEGTTAPVAPENSAPGVVATPGSGASTTWTVVDPYGQGIRILPVPSETGVVWQINLVGQMKPVRFTTLAQTLFPLTDDLEPHFRQGCAAQALRYSPEAKIRGRFKDEWALWKQSLIEARAEQDREKDEDRFVPERSVLSSGGAAGGYLGPFNPYNYPVG